MTTNRFDKSDRTTRTYDWPALQVLAIGAAVQVSAAIDNIEVMLCASERCFISVGATPDVTDETDGLPLEAGEKFHLQLTLGHKVSVIRDTADGFLTVLPVA